MRCLCVLALIVAAAVATPLDDYVHAPDSHYGWVDTGKTFSGPGYKGHILNMTSQQWLSSDIVDRSIWWHYVVVIVPDRLLYKDSGMLYITGGDNTDGFPSGTAEDELLCIALALANRVTCTVLHQIPNQPVHFTAEQPPRGRSEDAIIAYTWNHFLNNPNDPYWLLRLPMTKAAVRAMDCTVEYVQRTYSRTISKFIVAGASKRGWTTWTTGAVDNRIIAIVPIVMDALNFHTNVHHFWRALGGWSFALSDYYAMNFTRRIDDPNLANLTAVVDPYVYRDRLTMPKLVIDSTGDEFFMPDDNYIWWNSMVGEIHLLMVHNAEHSLVTGLPEVVQGISSFAAGVLANEARPTINWTMTQSSRTGSITVLTSEPPTKVFVRYADTLDGKRRDWRLITGEKPCPTIEISGECLHPVLWHTDNATAVNPTTYTYATSAPFNRWRAFLIEVEFRGQSVFPYVVTTQVNIVPTSFPFPDCAGEGCYGTLL